MDRIDSGHCGCRLVSFHPAYLFSYEENKVLQELSPFSSAALMVPTFGTPLTPILKVFNAILVALATLVKKSLHLYTLLALSVFGGLLLLQNHSEDLLSRRGPDKIDNNVLRDAIQSLRTLCHHSFPEFLADVELGATSRGPDTSTKDTGFTLLV